MKKTKLFIKNKKHGKTSNEELIFSTENIYMDNKLNFSINSALKTFLFLCSLILVVAIEIPTTLAQTHPGWTKVNEVEYGEVNNGSIGRLLIDLDSSVTVRPELKIDNYILQVTLGNAYVWPKIEKIVPLDGGALENKNAQGRNLSVTILAYQFEKKVVRIRAILPYNLEKVKDKIDLVIKGRQLWVDVPVKGLTSVPKDESASKVPGHNSFVSSPLSNNLANNPKGVSANNSTNNTNNTKSDLEFKGEKGVDPASYDEEYLKKLLKENQKSRRLDKNSNLNNSNTNNSSTTNKEKSNLEAGVDNNTTGKSSINLSNVNSNNLESEMGKTSSKSEDGNSEGPTNKILDKSESSDEQGQANQANQGGASEKELSTKKHSKNSGILNNSSYGQYVFKFTLFTVLVLGLFYILVTIFKKSVVGRGKLGFLSNGPMVTVLSSNYIAPKRSLITVKVHNQVFLLGNSEQGIHMLAEINDVPGILKNGEKFVTGSNFDNSVDEAGKQDNLEERVKLKKMEQGAEVENVNDLGAARSIEVPVKEKSRVKDIVRFSEQIRKKVRNLRPLQ